MNQMTFTNGIKELRAIWPERSEQLTDRAVRRYWTAVQHLTDEEFDRAVDLAIQECTYFPKPAELLQLAGLAAGPRGDAQNSELRSRVTPLLRGRRYHRLVRSWSRREVAKSASAVPVTSGRESCSVSSRRCRRPHERAPHNPRPQTRRKPDFRTSRRGESHDRCKPCYC